MQVFKNDPFTFIWKTFKELYPNARCDEIWLHPGMENGVGFTNFNDDGSVFVYVSANIPVCAAAEILAHELAHCAVGIEHEHDKQWDKAFEKILITAEKRLQDHIGGVCYEN